MRYEKHFKRDPRLELLDLNLGAGGCYSRMGAGDLGCHDVAHITPL